MKRLALVLAFALALPAAAGAKGPESGTITGPGLDGPIRLTVLGEHGSVGTLGRVAERGGLFAALGGPTKLSAERPDGDLGPRYTATFVMRDRAARAVHQHLYPYAEPLPVTYTPPGQKPFGTGTMDGGWFVADTELLDTLVEAGLPRTPPASAAGEGFELPQPTVLAPALLAAFGLAAGAALLLRRRAATAR